MTVLFYTISPRDAVGGAEGVRAALADGLRQRGHAVATVFTEPEADLSEAPRGRWALPVAGVRTWRKVPTPRSLAGAALSLLHLARCLRAVRPDVVNVHYVDVRAAYFVALRPLFGYRLVLTAHGSDVLRPFSAVNRAALPHLLRRADAVVAVTEAVAEGVREATPDAADRLAVIENGVDLSFWTPASYLDDAPAGPPCVVQVGRLHPVKGQDVMIRAWTQILDRHPDARLELIGEGGERAGLKALAERLGVAGSVDFLGALPPEAVRDRLQRAAVVALPSRSEGLPLSLLEAFGTGAATVATSVGGVPAAAGDPPVCLLVPPESPDALAGTIGRVLSDDGLAADLRERAVRRARAYSADRQVERTEALLERLLSDAVPPVRPVTPA